jgi:hypothetical protein
LEQKGSVLFLWGGVVSERAKNIHDLRKAIARGSFCDDANARIVGKNALRHF